MKTNDESPHVSSDLPPVTALIKKKLGSAFPVFLWYMESDVPAYQIATLFELKVFQVTLWREALTQHSRKLIPGLDDMKASSPLQLYRGGVMKALPILVLGFLMGCHSTSGTIDRERTSTEPYLFRYTGTQYDAQIKLKRMLAANGFQIAGYDSAAGVLSTSPKQLTSDERIDLSALAQAFTGVNTKDQIGYSTFIFDADSVGLVVGFRSYAAISMTQAQGYTNRDVATQAEPLPQGHPLNMKLAGAIRKEKLFTDITPKAFDYSKLPPPKNIEYRDNKGNVVRRDTIGNSVTYSTDSSKTP